MILSRSAVASFVSASNLAQSKDTFKQETLPFLVSMNKGCRSLVLIMSCERNDRSCPRLACTCFLHILGKTNSLHPFPVRRVGMPQASIFFKGWESSRVRGGFHLESGAQTVRNTCHSSDTSGTPVLLLNAHGSSTVLFVGLEGAKVP